MAGPVWLQPNEMECHGILLRYSLSLYYHVDITCKCFFFFGGLKAQEGPVKGALKWLGYFVFGGLLIKDCWGCLFRLVSRETNRNTALQTTPNNSKQTTQPAAWLSLHAALKLSKGIQRWPGLEAALRAAFLWQSDSHGPEKEELQTCWLSDSLTFSDFLGLSLSTLKANFQGLPNFRLNFAESTSLVFRVAQLRRSGHAEGELQRNGHRRALRSGVGCQLVHRTRWFELVIRCLLRDWDGQSGKPEARAALRMVT